MSEKTIQNIDDFDECVDRLMGINIENQVGLNWIETTKKQRSKVRLFNERAWMCGIERLNVPMCTMYTEEYNDLTIEELIKVNVNCSEATLWFTAVSPETSPAFLVACRRHEVANIEIITTDIRYSEDEEIATVLIGAIETDNTGISVVREYCIICQRAITGED